MSQVAYVNGAYAPIGAPLLSILDRGFQFADAIYEVWAVRDGWLADREAHMARLQRSLAELRIAAPMSEASLYAVLHETVRRNRVRHGIVYVQISRGAAPRDHAFPAGGVRPTLVVTAKTLSRQVIGERAARGVSVVSLSDERWARRDIKSVNLLANVLARQAAKEAGAFEAWLVDDAGLVTEGTSSTAWIVDEDGHLRTRPLSNDLLHGVTRAVLLQIARERQMSVIETAFTIEEAARAREAFLSGASNPVVPIIAVDGAPIGDGRPGPITLALRAAYLGGAGDPQFASKL